MPHRLVFLFPTRSLLLLLLPAGLAGWAQQPAGPKPAAATEAEVLRKATELTQNRQYESAFVLLNRFDPQHRRPAVVLRQTELALNYHLRSRELEGFGFVDLKPLERLDSLRERYTRAAIRHPFPVESVLKKLLQRYPTNYKLNRALADYYFQAEQCECAEAERSPTQLYTLMVRHYVPAHAHGYGDFSSYYNLGYAYQSLRRFAESVPAFSRAIALRPSYAPAHFKLAYSYTVLNKLPLALREARAAARHFDDPTAKSDALFLAENLEKKIAQAAKTKKKK